jgi:hypothetical protein
VPWNIRTTSVNDLPYVDGWKEVLDEIHSERAPKETVGGDHADISCAQRSGTIRDLSQLKEPLHERNAQGEFLAATRISAAIRLSSGRIIAGDVRRIADDRVITTPEYLLEHYGVFALEHMGDVLVKPVCIEEQR